jgi:ferredoxin-NADP reductase
LDLTVMLVVEQPSATWEHERGRIDEQKLTRLLSDFPVASAEILMCGPLPMIESVSELLLRVGARPDQIQYERFDYHAGSDPKSRIVRRRTQLVLAIALGLLVGAAAAGAYFS